MEQRVGTTFVEKKPPLRLISLVRELRQAMKGCETVLEVGCGEDSPMQYVAGGIHLEGLDIYEPALQVCVRKGFLRGYHLASALDLDRLFKPGSFDAVVALDLIEHLDKEEGWRLLDQMRRVARKRVVVFTPNGFVPQSGDENPFMAHRSGWEVSDFTEQGFAVVGMSGPKHMRGEKARIKGWPRWFWGGVSEVLQWVWTRGRPAGAFSLFCVLSQDVKQEGGGDGTS